MLYHVLLAGILLGLCFVFDIPLSSRIHVRDSLIKHRWLLTAELIWMIVCSFWAVSEQEKMYQIYHLSASTIDYVIAQQGAIYSGLTIFPFVLFFVIRCKQDSLSVDRKSVV